MNYGWLWWLGAALLLGVVEMLTVDLLFLMLAGGAVAGAIAAGLGAPFWVSALVAAAVSILLIFAVRPWALAHLKKTTPEADTNISALTGRTATVLADVTQQSGRIKLVGEVWTARVDQPGVVLGVGSVVSVVRIEGATAVVTAQAVPQNPSQPYGTPGPGY
ncbi:NfeD family protein [Occultella kanbiaonis]|uniref:NfeD family protein n=1 Tax=Occultella kanbiaonis TaxID=2675754 RepID=UPI0012B81D9B|nr:NfeD family protein [Occultella kanbiaonis]